MAFKSQPSRRLRIDRIGVGIRIARARRARRWTQKRLAQALDVSSGTVGAWEIGARVPSAQAFWRLAVALQRGLDWLIAGVPKRSRVWKYQRAG